MKKKIENNDFQPRFLNSVKKSGLPNLNEEEKSQRVHSSTNTLYVSSTLAVPNKDELLLW